MRRFLSFNVMLGISFILALLLLWPTLTSGLLVTDFWHKALLTGTSPIAPPHDNSLLGLFSFYSGEHARTQSIIDLGAAPWWTDTDLKMEFFRPLTEITHWIDYRLWPTSPAIMHAENIAWYFAVILMLGVFTRRLHTPDRVKQEDYRHSHQPDVIAGLAVLLFAISGIHAITVTWLACRNTLISTFFGLLTLYLHHQWREHSSGRHFALSLVALCTSLLSAEYGVSTLAFLASYALCLDRSPLQQRLRSVAPAFDIAILYLAFYAKSGFGVKNSELYTSPSDGVGHFIATVAMRVPEMLGANLSGLSLYLLQQPLTIKMAAIGFSALAALPLLPVLRQSRQARFFLLGALGALVPVSSVVLSDRVLLFSSIGIMPVIAEAIVHWAQTLKRPVASGLRKTVAGSALLILVLAHFVIAPLEFVPEYAFALQLQKDIVLKPVESIQQIPDLSGKTVIIINPSLPMASAGFMPVMATDGKPVPQHLWALAPGKYPVTIDRPDANSLRITPEKGFLLGNDAWYVHSHRKGFHVGDIFTLSGLTITVEALNDEGAPSRALFQFEKPLEATDFVWLRYRTDNEKTDSGICVDWTLPTIGEEVIVKNFS